MRNDPVTDLGSDLRWEFVPEEGAVGADLATTRWVSEFLSSDKLGQRPPPGRGAELVNLNPCI